MNTMLNPNQTNNIRMSKHTIRLLLLFHSIPCSDINIILLYREKIPIFFFSLHSILCYRYAICMRFQTHLHTHTHKHTKCNMNEMEYLICFEAKFGCRVNREGWHIILCNIVECIFSTSLTKNKNEDKTISKSKLYHNMR